MDFYSEGEDVFTYGVLQPNNKARCSDTKAESIEFIQVLTSHFHSRPSNQVRGTTVPVPTSVGPEVTPAVLPKCSSESLDVRR